MIFVTTGASEFQFNRMLKLVDSCLQDLKVPRDSVYFQIGLSCYQPRNGGYVNFFDVREIEKRIREADLVICHAGVGTVLSSLISGKKPIVIPRQREYGETVDDHQRAFAQHLSDNNLVFYPRNAKELKEIIASPVPPGGVPGAITNLFRTRSRLISFLTEQLDGQCGDNTQDFVRGSQSSGPDREV